jgi:hypothetical protein
MICFNVNQWDQQDGIEIFSYYKKYLFQNATDVVLLLFLLRFSFKMTTMIKRQSNIKISFDTNGSLVGLVTRKETTDHVYT